MYPQIALYFPLPQFTSQYRAIKQNISYTSLFCSLHHYTALYINMYPQIPLYFPLLRPTSRYSAIQQYLPLDSIILLGTAVYITIQLYTTICTPNRIHTSKFSSLSGHALCLFPRFIKYSMKTFASFKENTAFSSAAMTHLT